MARLHGKDRGLKPVQMADGKIYWQARLYHHGQEWRSKAIPSKQEARAIYTAKKAEFREAEYFPAIHQAKQSQLVTVADLMALVLADYRRQHRKTLSDAEEKARFWIALAGERKAAAITGNQLTAWADEWSANGLANSTINNYMSKLLRGYALAQQADPPLLSAAPHWKAWKPAPPRSGWMEWQTFAAVRGELPTWDRVPITLAYWTGMRSGEVKALRWDQFTFYHRTERVALSLAGEQTKTGQIRTIIWTGDLFSVLADWYQHSQAVHPLCPWVCHRNGKKLGSYDTAWKSACVKLGLATGTWIKGRGYWTDYKGPLLHDFRRTAARNLDRAGVSRDIARKITGHKTDSMYTRYNIVDDEDLADAGLKVVDYVRRVAASNPETGRKPDAPLRGIIESA